MASPRPTEAQHAADDVQAFTELREMYKRYMLNSVVARWLLTRDSVNDYRVVRKETTVMLSVSSASPPEVMGASHAPQTPFPASNDLMFLDHTENGFALGHIWGNIHTDTHPYAPLAGRANKTGWDKVKCRRFASDISIDGTLECVEYVWFTNDRAMVILSRTPFDGTKPVVRVSEILFFAPVERRDIPPQRPELVLLVHDSAVCTVCDKDICTCLNSLGLSPRSDKAFAASASCNGASGGDAGPVDATLLSWEDRARMVYHGHKRGQLTLVYSSSSIGDTFSRITVRQAYMSLCEDQNVIGNTIELYIRRLFATQQDNSRLLSIDVRPSAEAGTSDGLHPSDDTLALTQDLSGQSPMTYTPRTSTVPCEEMWLEDPGTKSVDSPGDPKPYSDKSKGCCSKPKEQCGKNVNGTGIAGAKNCAKTAADSCTDSLPSPLSSAESFPKGEAAENTTCGPEKAGKDCECSAETMPDPSLAMILNSKRDRILPSALTEMSSFMEPIIGGANNSRTLPLEPLPPIGRPFVVSPDLRDRERPAADCFPASIRIESHSPGSGRESGTTPLTSPLPCPALLQGETPLKRPRTETGNKGDIFPFGLEPVWPSSYDGGDKPVSLPPWSTGGLAEKPMSALGRALGVVHSPSPLTLMNHQPPKPISPHALTGPANGLGYSKIPNPECDFQNSFEHVVMPKEGGDVQKQDKDQNTSPTTPKRTKFPKRDASPLSASRQNNNEAGATNGSDISSGSGVCCEICGISFAKRGNKLRHIQTVHNRVKQFECDQCRTKFGLKADLRRHKFRIHESRSFRCHACGRSFAEQSQLDLHVRSVHEEDSRPWECEKCRIRFGRKSSLTRHEQTVHEQARFECRVCKKSYSQRFDAVRHERKVHGLNS